MSFFEPPPRPPRPEEVFAPEPRPPWERAPDNVLGGVVPLQLLLARSRTVAVTVRDLLAYRSGFSFELGSIRRGPIDRKRRRRRPLERALELRYGPEGELSPEFLRFGIELADRSKVTNLDGPLAGFDLEDPQKPPPGPVLVENGGGGSDETWAQDYWVWPLPPPGSLAFVCEWPAEAIPLTRTEIDAELLRDAAERAEFLWGEDEERTNAGGRWSVSRAIGHSFPVAEDDEEDDDVSEER